MIIGVNEFHLNIATVEKIVQHYFDTILFKDGVAPQVQSVSFTRSVSDTLLVRVTPKEDE